MPGRARGCAPRLRHAVRSGALADAPQHALGHHEARPGHGCDERAGPGGPVAVALADQQAAAAPGRLDHERPRERVGHALVRLVDVVRVGGWPAVQHEGVRRVADRHVEREVLGQVHLVPDGEVLPPRLDPVRGVDAEPEQVLQHVVGVEPAAPLAQLDEPANTTSAGASTSIARVATRSARGIRPSPGRLVTCSPGARAPAELASVGGAHQGHQGGGERGRREQSSHPHTGQPTVRRAPGRGPIGPARPAARRRRRGPLRLEAWTPSRPTAPPTTATPR